MASLSHQFSSKFTIKFKNQAFGFLLIGFLLSISLFSTIPAKAQVNNAKIQDSVSQSIQEPTETYLNYNTDYLAKSELEHQKLIRNIFVISFIFVLALLIFTMFFYGGKIKKVTNILVLQDEAL